MKEFIKSINAHWILSVGFPIYLVVFELLFRQFLKVDIVAFIPPTIAASGLGLLVEVLKPINNPKKVEAEKLISNFKANSSGGDYQENIETLQKILKDHNLYNKNDDNLIKVGYIFLLISLLLWFYSCALSLNTDSISTIALIVGIANYLIGIVFSTIKEQFNKKQYG